MSLIINLVDIIISTNDDAKMAEALKALQVDAKEGHANAAKLEAFLEDLSEKDAQDPVAEAAVETPVEASVVSAGEGYVVVDGIIQQGDEWRLLAGRKHRDGSRRRWRKVSDSIGKHVSSCPKSEFRRKI